MRKHSERGISQGKSLHAIPAVLLGDWQTNGERYRFNYDGNYAQVISQNYTIKNDQTLHLGNEDWERRAGTNGLLGTWRSAPDSQSFIDIVLGPYGFYSFVWNDGVAGGGYFTATDTQLFRVEQRAVVSCSGNQITFVSDNGPATGTFNVTGNTLTVEFADQSVRYTKVPF